MHPPDSRALILFLMMTAAATAGAQQPDGQNTPFLRFRLQGACRDLGSIQFIVAGEDENPANIKLVPGETREWTAKWDRPIPAKGSIASVRLGGHRTECRRSIDQRRDGNIEAYFVFPCDTNPAWNVKIATDPHRHFSFLRYLKPSTKDGCECLERAAPDGTGTTYDVRFPDETLNLQLARSLWIHLNSQPIFQKPKEGVGAQLNLDRKQIVDAITSSTFGEAFSSNARDAVEKNQTIKELESLSLTLAVK